MTNIKPSVLDEEAVTAFAHLIGRHTTEPDRLRVTLGGLLLAYRLAKANNAVPEFLGMLDKIIGEGS